MADRISSIGPDGRSLLTGASEVQYTEHLVPQELDYLINELRNPKSNASVQTTLGYLYHYMPQVKIESNLRVLFASFLNNPTCFGQNVPPFEINYLIIEVFKLVTDRKLNVSNPTLHIKTWYEIVLKELKSFVYFNNINSWKILPILAGILLSNELRDQLYSRVNVVEYGLFFRRWDSEAMSLYKKCLNNTLAFSNSKDITCLSLLSYAAVFKKNDDLNDFTPKIPTAVTLQLLIDLTYSLSEQYSSSIYKKLLLVAQSDDAQNQAAQNEVMTKPVIKHLNKLSLLIEGYCQLLPYTTESFECLMRVLVQLETFNKSLCDNVERSPFNDLRSSSAQGIHQNFWYLAKNILFSQIMVYQGILTRFIKFDAKPRSFFGFLGSSNASFVESQYCDIAIKILHNLYYLHFILVSVGQGGFDNYNFVYYVSSEIVNSNEDISRKFECFTQYLIGNYTEVNLHPIAMNNNYVMRSKVLFTLGLWENYLQVKGKEPTSFRGHIYECCMNLVNDKKYNDFSLVEAAHSVLLVYFSNTYSTDLSESLNYISLLVSQFPALLSSTQLSVAFETIGKSILAKSFPLQGGLFPDTISAFLHFIYDKCLHESSGIRIVGEERSAAPFTSAQPIQEIEANSSLKAMDKDVKTDIIKSNKSKKPKDFAKINLLPSAKSAPQEPDRKIPVTSREALVVSIMNLIPYLPLTSFIFWLNKIWMLVEYSNKSEQTYLAMSLWRVLSENLDLNRSDLAMNWWYETKKIVANDSVIVDAKL